MTHRQARRSLGSRTARRSGTKTRVIIGSKTGGKGAGIKYSTRSARQAAGKPRLAVRVRMAIRKAVS